MINNAKCGGIRSRRRTPRLQTTGFVSLVPIARGTTLARSRKVLQQQDSPNCCSLPLEHDLWRFGRTWTAPIVQAQRVNLRLHLVQPVFHCVRDAVVSFAARCRSFCAVCSDPSRPRAEFVYPIGHPGQSFGFRLLRGGQDPLHMNRQSAPRKGMTNFFRSRQNWDGIISPMCSPSSSFRILVESEPASLLISSFFRSSYCHVFGGSNSMFRTSCILFGKIRGSGVKFCLVVDDARCLERYKTTARFFRARIAGHGIIGLRNNWFTDSTLSAAFFACTSLLALVISNSRDLR